MAGNLSSQAAPGPAPAGTPVEPLQTRRLRGVSASVTAQMFGGVEGVLLLALVALPLSTAEDCCPVQLSLEIEGAAFLEHNRAALARAEVYVYAIGSGGDVAGYLAEAFLVDAGALGEAIWQGGLELHAELTLPPGSYTLRALVRNYQSGAFGRAELALEVPDPGSEQAVLLPPLFPEPVHRDSWLPVFGWQEADPEDATRQTAATDVAVARELTEALGEAAAMPVLVAGRATSFTVIGRRLPPQPWALGARLVPREGGGATERAGVELVESEPLDDRTERLGATLVAPDVPPGPYRLRLELTAGRTEVTAPELEVLVVGAGTRETDLRWSDLRGLLGLADAAARVGAEQVDETPPKRRRKSRRQLRRLAAEYRRAVIALESSPEAARAAVLDFETATLGRGDARALELLAGAEVLVADELAESDGEALVPLLDLHLGLYRVYRGRNLYSLLTHSRQRVEALAERLAGTDVPDAGANASRALAVLAGELQRATLLDASRRLFERAAALDPTNRAALLGMAALAEKQGRYGAAVAALEKLLTVAPDHAEGRLRLAVNHRRLGARDRARSLLRELAADEAPDWVRELALQELVLDLLSQGATEDAVAKLESAAEAPEGSGTLLLLAHLRDRQRQPRQALSLVERAVAENDPDRASPRWLYDTWPTEELDAVQRELAREAAARRQRLIQALGAGAEG